jgi:nucleoside-diphosphate-sugar epimerase
VLGFEATVPLEQGLAQTLDWCRTHYRTSPLAS